MESLLEGVGRRLEQECRAIRSGPGPRWMINREPSRGSAIHVFFHESDGAQLKVWIFDPRAVLGTSATYVEVPQTASVDELLALVRRAVEMDQKLSVASGDGAADGPLSATE